MNSALLLQMNPKSQFRLYDAILNMPTTTREIVLHPGPRKNLLLVAGTRVYLWEASGTDLVGKGTIIREVQPTPMPEWQHSFWCQHGLPDPHQDRVIIRLERCYRPPIKRKELQRSRVLAGASFFRNSQNTQGTCFNVESEVERELESITASIEAGRSK